MSMKRILGAMGQYLAGVLAIALLLLAMLGGMVSFISTPLFLRASLKASLAESQHKVEWYADEISQEYHLSQDTMAHLQGAAEAYMDALATWWGCIWRTPTQAWPEFPASAWNEREMTQLVMDDSGFQAVVEEDMRRATARDLVVYPMGELVRRYAFPVRESVTELLTGLCQQKLPLNRLLTASRWMSVVALLGAVGLGALHRRKATVLLAGGVSAIGMTLPLLMMNLPGMLRPLSQIAKKQCTHALLLGLSVWYAVALLLVLLGLLLLRRRQEG